MSLCRESCCCGAEYEGNAPTPFRAAHETCREQHLADAEIATAIREVGVTIAEAILAGAEYTEHADHARSLIGELGG